MTDKLKGEADESKVLDKLEERRIDTDRKRETVQLERQTDRLQ